MLIPGGYLTVEIIQFECKAVSPHWMWDTHLEWFFSIITLSTQPQVVCSEWRVREKGDCAPAPFYKQLIDIFHFQYRGATTDQAVYLCVQRIISLTKTLVINKTFAVPSHEGRLVDSKQQILMWHRLI